MLCCHSNETHAPIANPPHSAQLEGTLYHSSKLCVGPCSSVGTWRGTDRHTDGHDHYTSHFVYDSCKMKSYNPKVFNCVKITNMLIAVFEQQSYDKIVILKTSLLWHCWLGVRKSIQPVKNWVVRYWHGYLSGVRCKWFARYGPADVTATP